MRAYLSVSCKEGIVEFAKKLEQLKWEIVATGNTAKTLSEAGVKVINSSEITGFEELLGGRVKSLHPDIFASLLARESAVGLIFLHLTLWRLTCITLSNI